MPILAAIVCFNIDAGPLHNVATEWAQALNVSVLYDWPTVQPLWSHGISGCMTPQRGLAVALEGTGLTYEIITNEVASIAIIEDCRPDRGPDAPLPPCLHERPSLSSKDETLR